MVFRKNENTKAVMYIIFLSIGMLDDAGVCNKKHKRVFERVMGGHFWWF